MSNSHSIFPFEEFLLFLRTKGLYKGIDQELRVRQLIARLDASVPPERLANFLVSVLATSPDESELVHEAFDDFYHLSFIPDVEGKQLKSEKKVHVLHGETEVTDEEAGIRKRKIIAFVAALFIIIPIIGALVTWNPEPKPIPTAENQPLVKTDSQELVIDEPPVAMIADAPDPIEGNFDRQALLYIETIQQLNAGHLIEYDDQRKSRLNWIPWAASAIPLLALLLVWRNRKARRDQVLRKERASVPLERWELELLIPMLPVLRHPSFRKTSIRLRKRIESISASIDIDKTVAETARAAGVIKLAYGKETAPPEYLFLIQDNGPGDHRRAYFDRFTKALLDEGIFIDVFYFRTDPRRCYQEYDGRHYGLDIVLQQHDQSRIVLLGDGAALLNPNTGQVRSWIPQWLGDRPRSILISPFQRAQWGLREEILAEYFTLITVSAEGLEYLTTNVDEAESQREEIKRNRKVSSGINSLVHRPDSQSLKDLQRYLGPQVFEWVCACALYPDLYWNLTTYLGNDPVVGEDLLNAGNIYKILSLPWFASGSIPEEWRNLLIKSLDPEKASHCALVIRDAMEKTELPDQNTKAYEQFKLYFYTLNHMITGDSNSRNNLVKLREEIPEEDLQKEYTILSQIKPKSRSDLDFTVPETIRNLLFPAGSGIFGMRTSVFGVITVLISASLFLVASSRTAEPPQTEVIRYGLDETVHAVAYAPDGKLLAWAAGNLVYIWNDSIKKMSRLHGHQDTVRSISFSSDGNSLLSAANDIRFWNMDSMRQIDYFGRPFGSRFAARVEFAPNDSSWLIGFDNGDFQVWQNKNYFNKLKGLSSSKALTFTSDGQSVIAGIDKNEKHFLARFDANSLAEQQAIEVGSSITDVALARETGLIAIANDEHKIIIFDAGFRQIAEIEAHKDKITSLDFSPNGRQIMSASEDHTAKIWHIGKGKPDFDYFGENFDGGINEVVFSPDGGHIASAGYGGIRTGKPGSKFAVQKFTSYFNGVYGSDWSDDDRFVAYGLEDHSIRIHDLEEDSLTSNIIHLGRVYDVAFFPDNKTLASASSDLTIKVSKVSRFGELREKRVLSGHTDVVRSVAVSPDGTLLASGSWDKTVRIWDLQNTDTAVVLRGHKDWVRKVLFTPDGTRIISAGNDSSVRVWDVQRQQQIAVIDDYLTPVFGLAFAGDETLLTSDGKEVRVIDMSDWSTRRKLPMGNGFTYDVASINRDPSPLIAATSFDGEVITKSESDVLNYFIGHAYYARHISVNSDGTTMLTTSRDQSVRFWDIPQSNESVSSTIYKSDVFDTRSSAQTPFPLLLPWRDIAVAEQLVTTAQYVYFLNQMDIRADSISYFLNKSDQIWHDGNKFVYGKWQAWRPVNHLQFDGIKAYLNWMEINGIPSRLPTIGEIYRISYAEWIIDTIRGPRILRSGDQIVLPDSQLAAISGFRIVADKNATTKFIAPGCGNARLESDVIDRFINSNYRLFSRNQSKVEIIQDEKSLCQDGLLYIPNALSYVKAKLERRPERIWLAFKNDPAQTPDLEISIGKNELVRIVRAEDGTPTLRINEEYFDLPGDYVELDIQFTWSDSKIRIDLLLDESLLKSIEKPASSGSSKFDIKLSAGGTGSTWEYVGVKFAELEKFEVVIVSAGDSKINVIKAMREASGFGLKELKDIVDAAPSTFRSGLSKKEAEILKTKLEQAGAQVEIRRTGSADVLPVQSTPDEEISTNVDSQPVDEEIFTVVEQMPSFPGGETAIYDWISNNLKYPDIAVKSGIEGKVYVQFIVEKNGSATQAKVLRGIGGGCDEEALRLVNSMPLWTPGKQRAKTVRVSYTMPITFRLPY